MILTYGSVPGIIDQDLKIYDIAAISRYRSPGQSAGCELDPACIEQLPRVMAMYLSNA